MRRVLVTVGALVISFLPITGQSIAISDTVVVGEYEWAQVALFRNISWNVINSTCPDGVCSGQLITSNGITVEMDGWTWARQAFVGTNLFQPFSPSHPGEAEFVIDVGADYLTPTLIAAGFNLTLNIPTRRIGIYGYTADRLGHAYVEVGYAPFSVPNSTVWDSSVSCFNCPQVDFRGAWFYKNTLSTEQPTSRTIPMFPNIFLWVMTLIFLVVARRNVNL